MKKINKYVNPGRPKYTPKYPRGNEWTFTQFMAANDIETNPASKRFGKGPNCTMLTLRKNMERDMWFHGKGKPCVSANRTTANPRSLMVKVRGVTAEPVGEKGLGRRAGLYALRAKGVTSHVAPVVKAPKAVKTPKVQATVKRKYTRKVVSTSQTPTADVLDKIHAALAAPDPAPALIVPAVKIAPEAVPAPAPDPVVEVPAPAPDPMVEAPATSTLPVASLEPVAS